LWQGRESEIRDAVHRAERSGVDAVWPGCDLVPQTPLENIRALM
jgi:uroporphyrinogen-III decarboxylase